MKKKLSDVLWEEVREERENKVKIKSKKERENFFIHLTDKMNKINGAKHVVVS